MIFEDKVKNKDGKFLKYSIIAALIVFGVLVITLTVVIRTVCPPKAIKGDAPTTITAPSVIVDNKEINRPSDVDDYIDLILNINW